MMSRLRNIVQHNLTAKALALVIAVILWGYVMNDQNPSIESTYTVQLDVVNAPDGYKITKDASTVKLRVRGPRSLFVSATDSDFKAYVDLSKVEAGKHAVKVQTVLPQGFELVEAKPDTVTFTLDRIVQKKMKAEFIVTGSTAPGTTVAHIEPSVETVTIEGAESDIKDVTRVIGYVGLAGNGDDFKLKVPLTAINADGREVSGVTVKPDSAEVSVQLARGLMKKIVTVKPVLGDGLPDGYEVGSVKTDPVKIEIAGPEDVLAKLSSISTETISLDGLTKTTDKNVKLAPPDGVTVTNNSVTVHIEVKEKKKTQQPAASSQS